VAPLPTGPVSGQNPRMELYAVMRSAFSAREFTPEPVDDAVLARIFEHARFAPSGGNRQGWRWLVVTDAAAKKQIQGWYHELWSRVVASGYGAGTGLPEEERLSNERVMKSATYLAEHMHEAPVLIFACTLTGNGDITAGSSIYPAVQNLMLAARALGLGTALTTVHRGHQDDIRKLLGIPESVETAALIPVGWPKGKFGTGFRKPVEDVTYWERWGEKRP